MSYYYIQKRASAAMIKKRSLLTLVLPLLMADCFAQQSLDLFQATDNPEEDRTASRRPQRESQRVTEPAFSLVGTSRFGDEYYASLRHRDGSAVQVEWKQGTVVEIRGYSGFGVAQINSRKVSIRMPESEPCVPSEIKGVTCNGQFAVLSLSNAAPVARANPVEVQNTTDESGEESQVILLDSGEEVEIRGEPGQETIGNTNVLLRNPFSGEVQTARNLTPEELAEREERRQQRAERFRNFEIVRIPDDEIPEGMQRIRTPFGDRLEPVEE